VRFEAEDVAPIVIGDGRAGVAVAEGFHVGGRYVVGDGSQQMEDGVEEPATSGAVAVSLGQSTRAR
jgi:hypothetical protein